MIKHKSIVIINSINLSYRNSIQLIKKRKMGVKFNRTNLKHKLWKQNKHKIKNSLLKMRNF